MTFLLKMRSKLPRITQTKLNKVELAKATPLVEASVVTITITHFKMKIQSAVLSCSILWNFCVGK